MSLLHRYKIYPDIFFGTISTDMKFILLRRTRGLGTPIQKEFAPSFMHWKYGKVNKWKYQKYIETKNVQDLAKYLLFMIYIDKSQVLDQIILGV